MLDLIKSIDIEVAGYVAVGMIVVTIVLHCLLILKVVPYTWVNGGRSASFEAGKKASIIGVVALLITITFVLIASNIMPINISGIWVSVRGIILWIVVGLMILSTIMQLLGTRFERYVMSIVVFILLISVLRMALETNIF